MGAWSEQSFGNDTTCDWLGDFLEAPALSAVDATIQAVLRTSGYLDADPASAAIGACEVLARLQGRWGVQDAYSEELDDWVRQSDLRPTAAQCAAAVAALDRIVGAESELHDLWADSDHLDAWLAAVADLRQRVSGGAR